MIIATVTTSQALRTATFATVGEASEYIVDMVRAQFGPTADGVRIAGEGKRGTLVDQHTGETVGTWKLRG